MSVPTSLTPRGSDDFAPTRWTRVLAAQGRSSEAQQALSELCAAYYAPVVAFLRREGRDADTARELAHEFFAGLLEGSSIQRADPRRGRFRSYLVGALKHFLANRKVHAARVKRGGAAWHEPLAERDESSESLSVPDPATTPTELLFDRAWALSLIDRAFAAMLAETTDPVDLREFEILKPWLTGQSSEQTQAEAARQLGLSDGAMRVRIHRLRRRFRDLVKAEIAQTVQDPAEVGDELRHLIAVWGAARGA